MAANPKIEEIPKVTYLCVDCGEATNRKPTEPAPKRCPFCHVDIPTRG